MKICSISQQQPSQKPSFKGIFVKHGESWIDMLTGLPVRTEKFKTAIGNTGVVHADTLTINGVTQRNVKYVPIICTDNHAADFGVTAQVGCGPNFFDTHLKGDAVQISGKIVTEKGELSPGSFSIYPQLKAPKQGPSRDRIDYSHQQFSAL